MTGVDRLGRPVAAGATVWVPGDDRAHWVVRVDGSGLVCHVLPVGARSGFPDVWQCGDVLTFQPGDPVTFEVVQ